MSLEELLPGDVVVDGRVQSHVLHSNEILTEIAIPAAKPGSIGTFQKIRPRGVWDFAMASVALNLQVDAGKIADARVIFGGIAVTPYREHAVEAYLKGKPLDGGLPQGAAARALLNAAPLKYNEHKIETARGALASGLAASPLESRQRGDPQPNRLRPIARETGRGKEFPRPHRQARDVKPSSDPASRTEASEPVCP